LDREYLEDYEQREIAECSARANRVKVKKIFIEQPSSEPKVKVLIPMYEPLEIVKCKKCGNT